MKIEDAIIYGEMTTAFMRSSFSLQGIEIDKNTMALIEVIETLSRFAKENILKNKINGVLQ